MIHDVSRSRSDGDGCHSPTDATGAGGLDLSAVHGQPFDVDAIRFVIRFAFPWDDDAPRYACPHPDPPGDWAFTGEWGLYEATTFATYARAARVLNYDYGRRTHPRVRSNGHYGTVAILAEEIHALTGIAARAAADLAAELGEC